MKRSLLAVILVIASVAACAAQPVVATGSPKISGFVVSPVNATQCRPVKISVTIINLTNVTIFSQRPYAGAGYNIYQSFGDRGYTPLPDRYMVGISLNGGADGYPYRWGFHGALLPRRTATIECRLTMVELGFYRLTAALLKGGVPVGSRTYDLGRVTVEPCEYAPPPSPPVRPYLGRPIYPVINGQFGYPPIVPYVINGYSYFPAQDFLFTIGGNVYIKGPSVLITVPGYQLVAIPGLDYGYLNGLPVQLPMPLLMYGGVPYVSPRMIMPLFGGSMFWDPDDRELFLNNPWQPGY